MSKYVLRTTLVVLNVELLTFFAVFFYSRAKHLSGVPSVPYFIGVVAAVAALYVLLLPQVAAARKARAGISQVGQSAPSPTPSLILAAVSLVCFGYGLLRTYTFFLAH